MKKILIVAVLLFGILLTSTIGASTAAAKQTPNAVVKAPKSNGENRAYIHVPQIPIDESPVIYPLENIPEE